MNIEEDLKREGTEEEEQERKRIGEEYNIR
jgi:hypothetical protein